MDVAQLSDSANRRVAGPVGPPVPYLVFAAVGILASVALLFTGPLNDTAHFLGWLAAGVVTIGAVAAFSATDLRRRQQPNYAPQRSAGTARWGLAISAIVLCVLHAWTLAWSLAAR